MDTATEAGTATKYYQLIDKKLDVICKTMPERHRRATAMTENKSFGEEHSSRQAQNRRVVDAYAAWIENLISEQFWQGWMISFMFEEMNLSQAGTKAVMQQEVIGFVKKLSTRFHRRPTCAAAYKVIPRLIGCPDYPVPKYEKEGFRLR